MEHVRPETPQELAECLRAAAQKSRIIRLEGRGSKQRAGGPTIESDVCITTEALDQVYQYEPRDLTVSVGAGMPWAKFVEMLDGDGYMVPLDPPFARQATVGGVIASNSSGPRRRGYGTARDLVIGMKFATLEGKLVQSGGMVVKNVAGLDMGKLMIGSLGTLAAIAVVNFKLIPKPFGSRTFLYACSSAQEALALRDRLLRSPLQPVAVDLLSPEIAAETGHSGWVLAIGVDGSSAVLQRWERELNGAQMLVGQQERDFWCFVEEFTPRFLAAHPEGAVWRVSVKLSQVGECASRLGGKVLARAGNGVCYAYRDHHTENGWAAEYPRRVMEYGPEARAMDLSMWPQTDSGFAIMQRIKKMFDPNNLLNPGRYYGRL